MIINLINSYKNFVFGDYSSFNIQKRIFLLITHISILVGIVGIIINVVLDLGLFLTSITFLTLVIVGFFHIKVRNSELDFKYAFGFFITSVVTFTVFWFYNGGYNGNTVVLIFVYFVVNLTILPSKLRFLAFVITTLMIAALTTFHFAYPDMIVEYQSESQRYIDLILGFFIYLVLLFSILNTILGNYEKDRVKINSQNDQLSLLIEKLNDAKNKMEDSFKQVDELNSTKDRFITLLSHDLRSPFSGLLGITKMMDNEYDTFTDSEKRFYLSEINKSLDKLYTFLEELLLWGRVQKSSFTFNFESSEVKPIVDRAISILSDTASRKNITVNLNCEEDNTAVLDKDMISTVIRNLLSNAIKFSKVGGNININVARNNGTINLAVMDEGVGIPEKFIKKLFKLDEIASTIGTEGEIGSGMGLILCSDIVKSHKGTISVESVEGKGTTFFINLPVNNSIQKTEEAVTKQQIIG